MTKTMDTIMGMTPSEFNAMVEGLPSTRMRKLQEQVQDLQQRYDSLVLAIDAAHESECGSCGSIRRLYSLAHQPVFKSSRSA